MSSVPTTWTTADDPFGPVAPPARGRRGAAIGGAGRALPARRVSNDEIAGRFGADGQWIAKRTGIVERRVAAPQDTAADFAAQAGISSLEAAGCPPAAVDLVIVATMTPDQVTPNVASVVVDLIDGLRPVGALDINAACTGWIGALGLAAGYVESGRADHVLVIGADLMTRVVDPTDRATASVFADGAGAVLVSACEGSSRIGPVVLGTDPAGAPLIYAPLSDRHLRMKGGETFGAAVARLVEGTEAALARAGMTVDDIDVFAYHQANLRILRSVGEQLGLPEDRVIVCVDRYANTSAATIPIALVEAVADGRLVDGAKVLMATFGAGFQWGASVVQWGTYGSRGR